MRALPALRNAPLRRLLLAQMPADFADWLDFVAIGALLAFVWQVEPVVFALLAVSMGLPYLLVGPLAGVLVDRSQIRTVLIWSNLGRGMVTAAFFLAPDWPQLLALVALRSSVDTFFTPAKQAAIQALTEQTDRTSANGLSHAINQAAKIVAPAGGGTLLIWFAPGTVFLMNAAVSVLAALLVARVPELPRATGDEAQTGMIAEMRAGLAELRETPLLRAALLMMAAGYFAMFVYDTFIAPLTRDLGFDETHLGLALAAVGAGGVLGATLFGVMEKIRCPFRWVGAGAAISTLLIAGLGLSEMRAVALPLPVFLAAFGLLGLCSAMAVVPFRTVIQNTVPEGRLARVTALSEAANMVALLSAPFLGAYLAAAFSVGAPFVCGAVVMGLIALRALTLRTQDAP